MFLKCISMGSRRGRWMTIVNGPNVFNSQTRRNFTYQKRCTVKRHCGRCLLLGEVTSFLLQGPPLGCWTRRPRFSQRPWPEELVGCCFCSERKPHATSNFIPTCLGTDFEKNQHTHNTPKTKRQLASSLSGGDLNPIRPVHGSIGCRCFTWGTCVALLTACMSLRFKFRTAIKISASLANKQERLSNYVKHYSL